MVNGGKSKTQNIQFPRRGIPDLEQPADLKNSISREQFKSGLKTWLFVQAYS